MDTTNYEVKYCGKTYTITRNANGKFVMPEEIKKLEGSMGGAQFKPAVEVILVAMKPMDEKTFASQALANGHGITWLDDVRIPYASSTDAETYDNNRRGPTERSLLNEGDKTTEDKTYDGGWKKTNETPPMPQGRFPANLLVSDSVLDNGVITKGSGVRNAYTNGGGFDNKGTGTYTTTTTPIDKGSYSRYFDLDAWANQFPFLIVPKASKKEKNAGCENLPEVEIKGRDEGQDAMNVPQKLRPGSAKNHHPTVKPLRLMSYLITMGSRPNQVVLDPFAGSFTTCVAAQQLKRRWVGIEMSEEYCNIGRARLGETQ